MAASTGPNPGDYLFQDRMLFFLDDKAPEPWSSNLLATVSGAVILPAGSPGFFSRSCSDSLKPDGD